MERLCFLKIATILVVFHVKGTDARPKRSLLPDNIQKTYFAPKTSYLDRPKREDLTIRPKLTNSIRESVARPKRSNYEHETIGNALPLEEITRPKIQQSVENIHSKAHTKNVQKKTTQFLRAIFRQNRFVEPKDESKVEPDYDRKLNKIANKLIERLCRTDKALSLCVKARRPSKKAWGNPALPPQS